MNITNKRITKLIGLTVCLSLLLCSLCACGGNVGNVQVIKKQSALYTTDDINAAVDTVVDYFAENFKGCKLREIYYAGDDREADCAKWAAQYGADEAIVLISTFDVDASGGDGSLNPDSTYDGWQWILIRDSGERWRHVDHGY